jgi:diguanylate cyclase (GGDEF)-like protein/PAS domain S-box-containing protein
VRIGIVDDPPFNFFDKKGQAAGFFPELFNTIAREQHWEIEYTPCAWSECLDQLTRNEIDILPDIAYTKERATRYKFASETVIESAGRLYHHDGISIASLPDLDGKKVAVIDEDIYFTGSAGLKQLANNFHIRPTYVRVDSYAEAFALLTANSVDAALVDQVFGETNNTNFTRSSLKIMQTQIRPAFSLASDPQLRINFDEYTKISKGLFLSEFYQLKKKWLANDTQPIFPVWLKSQLAVLSAFLLLLALIILITRHQIRRKTQELAEKNLQLEQELNAHIKAKQRVKEQNFFLQSVIDSVPDPLTVIDLNGRILQANKASREHFEIRHRTNAELGPLQTPHLPPMNQVRGTFEEISRTRQQVVQIHTRYVNGIKHFIEMSASPLFDSTGHLYAIVEVLRDITARMQMKELLSENEKRLHHLAHYDSLTSLPNRLFFDDRLEQAIRKARRSRQQFALFFLDLNHFKEINDNLGHEHGDRLLKDVAKRLRNCLREADTVARTGGDEFLVLLEEIDSMELIEATAQRISNALKHTLSEGDYSQEVSTSIGIALFPKDADNALDLLSAADHAMYRAKKSGKATYQFFQ